eukprot:4401142-Amphidinium_carterae.1
MNPNSTLLVYGNEFSCKLPRHYGAKLTSNASLSLVGNHFSQPRLAPTWIMPAEQPADIDSAEKNGLAHAWSVRARQVSMARDLPAPKLLAVGILGASSLLQQHAMARVH